MTNREIAAILFNIATLLKRQDGNPYRIRAYRRTAWRILRLRHALAERIQQGLPLGIPRVGESLGRKISELAKTGHMAFYEELCAALPPREQALLKVPGIGPILAERISKELGKTDLAVLVREAAAERLQQVWGIGPRRAAAIIGTVIPEDDFTPPTDDVALPVHRHGNVVYVQQSLWSGRSARKAA
jgi:DNA polymerase/3'-5' exonuclease PolX